MKRVIGSLAAGLLLLTMALPAASLAGEKGGKNSPPPPGGNPSHGPHGNPGGHPSHAIPEFDPAALGAIGALVAGGVVLVARRRRR